jgi:hypothetical protein
MVCWPFSGDQSCKTEPLIILKAIQPFQTLMRHLFAYPYLCATKRLPKTWPRPAVSEGPPAIWRPNAIKPDQLLSNAQRAPEGFFSFGVTACIGRVTMQSGGYLSNASLPALQFPPPNATPAGIIQSVVHYGSITSTELLYNVSLSMQR